MRELLRFARERKLDRVAAVYAVTGWILVQAASIAFPTFGAPVWVLRALIALAIIGFPAALGIAWAVSPAPAAAPEQKHSRREEWVLIALLGGVLVLSAAQLAYAVWFRAPLSVVSHLPVQTRNDASIAVLPFVNMSGDPAKEYFSDGISEELLNDLANNPALKVAARTSSFSFKGKSENIESIARSLNVRTVLEGSVREDGNRVRITAQLINAASGYHLWSATYDRELTSILAVQDEIATAIAGALTSRLLTPEPKAGNPSTINPQAYREYLEARAALATRTPEGKAKAVALLQNVTTLQPDFADGYAVLSRAYLASGRADNRQSTETYNNLAAASADAALRLDPDNLVALTVRTLYQLGQMDWNGAHDTIRHMRATNPNHPDTLEAESRFYGSMGYPQVALALLRRASALDPMSKLFQTNVALLLNANNQSDEADRAAARVIAGGHVSPILLYVRCEIAAGRRDVKSAQSFAEALEKTSYKDTAADCKFMIAVASGDIQKARQMVDRWASSYPAARQVAFGIAEDYAQLGEYEKSMEWVERSSDQGDAGTIPRFFDEEFEPLRRTARGQAFMQRPDVRNWKAAHDALAAEVNQMNL